MKCSFHTNTEHQSLIMTKMLNLLNKKDMKTLFQFNFVLKIR